MSKLIIVEGNSNDKDNVRALMVKGETGNNGISPSATVTRETGKAVINITDKDGTTSSDVFDGISPTVATSKSNGVTTITITDINGPKTATINDGEVTNASLNTTLDNRVGVNSNLATTEKGTIVGAINEVNTNVSYKKASGDFVVLVGSFTLTDGQVDFTTNYPTGLTYDNCVVISCMLEYQETTTAGYTEGYYPTNVGYLIGALGHGIKLQSENIRIVACNPADGSHTSGNKSYNYKIVLMKI